MSLENKVVVLNGAAGGIGAAIAARFAKAGAKLFLTDVNETALASLAVGLGPEVAYAMSDATDEDQVRQAFRQALNRFDRLDTVILNAGISGPIGMIGDVPVEAFDRVMQVNLKSVFLGLTCSMPLLKAQGSGSIIIMSSVGGVRGTVGMAPYVASKHAVIGLMRTAALEGAPHGVRVNTVNPAAIETDMMRAIERGRNPGDAEAARQVTASAVPMKRYGKPDEVAAMVAFLASDDASFCSGNTYLVDGGSMAGPAAAAAD